MKRKLKILFATFPADGHVNPLTALAVHLKYQGHDVRWYTSSSYADKMNHLGIQHYPLVKALDVQGDKVDEIFPERKKHKSQIAKLKFDIINAFVLRGPEYFEDLKDIYSDFKFELVIADVAFTAVPMIREVMNIPVIAASIMPLCETSKDLGPYGLGLTPSPGIFGQIKQSLLRFISDQVLFKKPYQVMKQTLAQYGISPDGNLFDTVIRKATMVMQSGTPGFDYYRSDLNSNVHYVGSLLPYSKQGPSNEWFHEKLNDYNQVILVTQGTVEKDVEKIIVPTLEAYKDTKHLVVVTTGGSGTEDLRKRYTHDNIIIEDFIPFNTIMPYADVYVTNGGYGGVMLSIQNKLPMVAAGVHEGKNEICARIGYFKLGFNLKTERPSPYQIKSAVDKVLNSNMFKENVSKLAKEFSQYNPNELCSYYINKLFTSQQESKPTVRREPKPEAIY